ncbi:MAG TPA: histidine phosphatase family protein [Candidatus Saccharimonadales bacterium]|nr:histidine phosphatase family protein [Candidatus Saccharimonadales bacterium]
MQLIFESHATSFDNEAHLSSGWNDVALSPRGEQEAKGLGERYDGQSFDAIFCSDLQRSVNTAKLAFGDKFPIIQDKRLRECDYGDYTQKDKAMVDVEKPKRITTPFPNGESYEQACARMTDFLNEVRKTYVGKRIMIIGHRVTQYGIEQLVSGKSLAEIVTTPWKWQPGWTYQLD